MIEKQEKKHINKKYYVCIYIIQQIEYTGVTNLEHECYAPYIITW